MIGAHKSRMQIRVGILPSHVIWRTWPRLSY